jgi:hypothetical protein
MQISYHLVDAGRIEMRVNLSCLNAGVAEQFLQDPEVCSAGMKMRCKGMPQNMG